MVETKNSEIWAVGSGKGGIGKTAIATGIAVMLQRIGKEVVLVDCNLGSPNVHSRFGITRPKKTLNDYLSDQKLGLEDVMIDIPTLYGEGILPNIKLIAGSSGTTKLTDIISQHNKRLINGIKKLKADYVVMDLGPNPNNDTLDLYDIADKKLIVLHVGDRACVESNYSFLMAYMYRKTSQLLLNHQGVSISAYKARIESLNRELKEGNNADTAGLKMRISELNTIYEPLRDMQEFIRESQNPQSSDYSKTFTEFLVKLEAKDKYSYLQVHKNAVQAFRPLLVISRVKSASEKENGRLRFADAMKKLIGIDVTYAGYVSENPEIQMSARTGKHFILENSVDAINQFGMICGSITSVGKNNSPLGSYVGGDFIDYLTEFENKEDSSDEVPDKKMSSQERTEIIRLCNSYFSRKETAPNLDESIADYERRLTSLKDLFEKRPEARGQILETLQQNNTLIINNYFSPLLEKAYANKGEYSSSTVQKATNLLMDLQFNKNSLRLAIEKAKVKLVHK